MRLMLLNVVCFSPEGWREVMSLTVSPLQMNMVVCVFAQSSLSGSFFVILKLVPQQEGIGEGPAQLQSGKGEDGGRKPPGKEKE